MLIKISIKELLEIKKIFTQYFEVILDNIVGKYIKGLESNNNNTI